MPMAIPAIAAYAASSAAAAGVFGAAFATTFGAAIVGAAASIATSSLMPCIQKPACP